MSHPASTAGNAERISAGMQRLGASASRGDCFGRRVSKNLGADEGAEAAAIVERAISKSDMRDRVLEASKPVRRAFIGANMRCSLA